MNRHFVRRLKTGTSNLSIFTLLSGSVPAKVSDAEAVFIGDIASVFGASKYQQDLNEAPPSASIIFQKQGSDDLISGEPHVYE